MEDFLLRIGLSHTWSKALPYLIVILFGLFLARLVYRRFRSNKKTGIALSLFFLIVPFIAYFAVNPIYQGDFGKNGREQSFRNAKTTLFHDGLLVIAIPGCPFCMESIEGLKQMKKRRPKLKIEFTVIGTSDKKLLKGYKKAIDGKFKLTKLHNETAFTENTGNSFPTFVLIKKGKAVFSWSNNDFGVRAKDAIENWDD